MAVTAPLLQSATAISTTRIDLAWVNRDNYDEIYIERKVGGNGGWVQIDQVDGREEYYVDESPPLTPEETYDYQIRGRIFYPVDEYSGYSGTKSATTFAVLAAPSDLVVTAFADFIEIVFKDNSSAENKFQIAREKDVEGEVEEFAWTAANMDYYKDEAGIVAASVYKYRVRAWRGGGDTSAWTGIVSATALSIPGNPAGLGISEIQDTSMWLTWTGVANETGYKILISKTGVFGGEEVTKVIGADIVTFLATGLDSNQRYWFRVYAYNGVGDSAGFTADDDTTLVAGVYTPTEFEKWIRNPNIEPVYLAEIYTKMDLVGFPLMSDDDLVGCWPFDELSGMVATDKSGNGNDGILENMEEEDHVDGKVGKALDFDGVDEYVDLTGFTDAGTTHTFAFWVYSHDSTTGRLYLFDSQTGRLIVGWGSDTPGKIGIFDGVWREFGNSPGANIWHHVVFVFNGTTSKVKMYLNGSQYGAELNYIPRSIGGATMIGSLYTGAGNFFNGLIDEVRIYKRALTEAEVKQLHDTPGHRIHEILIPAEDRGIDILGVFEGGDNYSKETSKADVQTNAESFYFHYDNRKLYLHTSADENPSDFLIEGAFWLYFSTHKDIEFTANGRLQHFLPLLAKEDIPNITQEIKPYFEGNFGMSSGSIAFMNAKIGGEHFFDEKFATYTWINAKVILKAGSDALPVFTYAQFKEIFTGYIDSKSCRDTKITFQLRDLRKVMSEPIVLNKFSLSNYPDMDEQHIGKPIPVAFGLVEGAPIPIDISNQKWKYHDGRSKSVENVWRNGVLLTEDTHYYVDLQRSIITFNRDGAFIIEAGVNDEIDFKEGGVVRNATLTPDTYTTAGLADHMKVKMDLAGGYTYTVTCSAAPERRFTISAVGGAFDLLWRTGVNGKNGTDTHVGTAIGFDDDEDDEGKTSYEADEDAITVPEADLILVSFTGIVNSADEVIRNGAEIFKYLMNNYKSLTDPELNLDSIYEAKYANENVLGIPLEAEPSFDEIVRTIEHSIEAYTFQDELGRLGIKPQQTVAASNAKYVVSKHIFAHSQRKDRSTLFWKVNIYYNKDYEDNWDVKTATSNVINWKYKVTEELPIYTYFTSSSHASDLATSILSLLNKEQIEDELPMLLFDVMAGDLVVFSRGRFYNSTGIANEITLRILRISKSPRSGRTSITTEIVN